MRRITIYSKRAQPSAKENTTYITCPAVIIDDFKTFTACTPPASLVTRSIQTADSYSSTRKVELKRFWMPLKSNHSSERALFQQLFISNEPQVIKSSESFHKFEQPKTCKSKDLDILTLFAKSGRCRSAVGSNIMIKSKPSYGLTSAKSNSQYKIHIRRRPKRRLQII